MKRLTFIGSSALGATAIALQGQRVAVAEGPPGGTDLVERRANFDEATFDRILGRAAQYRMLWEGVKYVPTFLNNVKNSLNGLEFGFGADPRQIVTAIAGHGPSSAYTYSDYVWQKYRIGEFFDLKDASGQILTKNVFLARTATSASNDPNDEHGPFQDTSVEALQGRGVTFLTCHTAVEEQSRALVKRGFAPAGATASEVAVDILTHLIPGAMVVPSMVATIGVLQTRYHYAYLTIQ
jgi:intracellular sulfur oxidation DsrE/DsrF family protein